MLAPLALCLRNTGVEADAPPKGQSRTGRPTPGKSKAEFGERDPGESGTNEGQHQTGALGRITRLDSALRA
jgi:hypothetical protein